MRTGEIPDANAGHYLLSHATGRAALKKLSLRYPDRVRWIELEQNFNDRTTCKGDYPIQPLSVPTDFWPERQPVFWLPEFAAPKDQFRLLQNPKCSLPWYFSGSTSDSYSHLVHPLSVSYFLSRRLTDARWKKPRFLATPMASHRTLLVWNPRANVPPFAVKTSVNVWIGGLNRNVRLLEIQCSVGMSSLLAAIPKTELQRQGILFLDDPVGLLHRQTNAGVLARDIPTRLDPGEEIVPLFSLLADSNGKRPLIVDLISSSRLEPTAWVDKFIFKPLIYQAYFLAMNEGLVGEMHEQNILMQLRNGQPTKRFWHRDFGGFLLDKDLRRLANKDFSALPRGIQEWHLGRNLSIFHEVLRMYLQGSTGYAVAHALRKYFQIKTEDFSELYKLRVSELQQRVLAAKGIRTTRNFEKDIDRFRQRKTANTTWPWKSFAQAFRDW